MFYKDLTPLFVKRNKLMKYCFPGEKCLIYMEKGYSASVLGEELKSCPARKRPVSAFIELRRKMDFRRCGQ